MKSDAKSKAKSGASGRQSVTLPAKLAKDLRQTAKRKHLTMSRTLVELAERGLAAEAASKRELNGNYRRFMSPPDAAQKDEAGKDLIRAIFGPEAIAEDPLL